MRHILLATTGQSPQVVTETLYAIAEKGGDWPDQISLITTSLGEKRARTGLLVQGHLQRLCDELGRPAPQFGPDDILVVPNAQGQPVDDARSLEDHEALANFIMRQMRDLTADDACAVHASLAGGRKTMTFYLGYAMSLFGRVQDRLSHVLISQGYESHPDFWFPSKTQAVLLDRDGRPLQPKDAQVTLAPIPFIRLRANLPTPLQKETGEVNLHDLVRAINLAEQPEDILLTFDIAKRNITLCDRQKEMSPVVLEPGLLELALYLMFAQATRDGDTQLTRPDKNSPSIELATRFVQNLLRILGLPEEERVADGLDALESWVNNNDSDDIDENKKLKIRTLETFWCGEHGVGMRGDFFSQRNNAIKTLLEDHLPVQLCERLTPKPLYDQQGQRKENTKGGGYGIDIPAVNISIVG